MDLSQLMMAYGSGMQAGSQLGIAAEGSAEASGKWLDFLAQQELTAGQQQADVIQKRGTAARGAAKASYAASGVKVGSGSAQAVDDYIAQTADQDALSALINSTRRSSAMTLDAKLGRIAGKQARTAGYISAASSLLGSGYQMSGWGGSSGSLRTTGSYEGNLPTRGGK